MKRVKNLTENKGLINTFKKFKSKNHTFKTILKKKYFFFTKFQQNLVLRRKIFFIKRYYGGLLFMYLKCKTYNHNIFVIRGYRTDFFKKILMFY